MKRSLIVVLSVLMATWVIGCPTLDKDKEEKKDDTETIAAEYRGMYVTSNRNSAYEVTGNEVVYWEEYNLPSSLGGKTESYRWPAWTVESELWVNGIPNRFDNSAPAGISEFKLGDINAGTLTVSVGTYNNTFTKE